MEIKIIKSNKNKIRLLLNDYEQVNGNKCILLYGETAFTVTIKNAYILKTVNDKNFCEQINYFLEMKDIDTLFLWLDRELNEIDEIILTLLKSKLSKLFIYIKEDKNNEMH